MKRGHCSILLLLVLCVKTGFSQVDTSDVFIISDEIDTALVEDKALQKRESFIKYDVGRLTFAEVTISYEMGLKGRSISIEPEITAVWLGQGAYFFNYLTDSRVENRSFFTSTGFGLGLTAKKHIGKNKKHLYGSYFSIKIRSRFSPLDQEASDFFTLNPSTGKQTQSGYFSLSDLYLNYGYSLVRRGWFQFDFLLGGGATLSYFKHSDLEIINNVNVWTTKTEQLILPTLNFGFRMGVSPQFFVSKFKQYSRVIFRY